MIKKIKHYNAYYSRIPRLLVLIVFPMLFLLVSFLLMGGVEQSVPGAIGVYIALPTVSLSVLLIGDRVCIGPIYSKERKEVEFLKSSDRGGKVFLDVIGMDMLARFVVYTMLCFLNAALLIKGRGCSAYADKILFSSALDAVSLHAVTELGTFIIRRIQNASLFVLILYGIELTLAPTIIAIVMETTSLMIGMMFLYLAMDVVLVCVNHISAKKLVAQRWYNDTI